MATELAAVRKFDHLAMKLSTSIYNKTSIISKTVPMEDQFLKWIPFIGVALSFYSALFATFILYPWHLELSREFAELQAKC